MSAAVEVHLVGGKQSGTLKETECHPKTLSGSSPYGPERKPGFAGQDAAAHGKLTERDGRTMSSILWL